MNLMERLLGFKEEEKEEVKDLEEDTDHDKEIQRAYQIKRDKYLSTADNEKEWIRETYFACIFTMIKESKRESITDTYHHRNIALYEFRYLIHYFDEVNSESFLKEHVTKQEMRLIDFKMKITWKADGKMKLVAERL
jgi:hypothetical protein